jgi:hypothetical protein
MCFRNCVCEGVINTAMVFQKFGCDWRERNENGEFAIIEAKEGKTVLLHGT